MLAAKTKEPDLDVSEVGSLLDVRCLEGWGHWSDTATTARGG
jgi:hypothetical protein